MKIYDVIEYEGPSNILVWKHAAEDFNTMSQLVVHESQEAVFFKNGEALDLLGPGRHTLETQNIPILGRLARIPSAGVTPFHCEVYFINKAVSMDIVWGTNSPILLQDPQYSININIRANGQMALAVKDSRKLLVKLVGTTSVFAEEEIGRYFKNILMMYIKDIIANAMIANRISINTVSGKLIEISEIVKRQLDPVFDEYGMALRHFNIGTINSPLDDPGYMKIQAAIADATARNIQGYTWQEEQAYGVAQTAAGNEGIAGTMAGAGMGAGMGIGMGLPMGMGVGAIVNRAMQPVFGQQPQQTIVPSAMPGMGAMLTPKEKSAPSADPQGPTGAQCPACKAIVPAGSRFCNMCGMKFGLAESCKSCRASMPAGSKFCPDCGKKTSEPEE